MVKKGGLITILALTVLVANPFKSQANIGRPTYLEKNYCISNKSLTLPCLKDLLYSKKLVSFQDVFVTDNFSKDNEEVLLARMILGEAEACSTIEKKSVAYTAINRAKDGKKWNGTTVKEAILVPNQYSCFNNGTASSKFLKNPMRYNPKDFLDCLNISKAILKKTYSDPSKGATHYYNPSKVKEPSWTRHMIKIGRIQNGPHVYYKER